MESLRRYDNGENGLQEIRLKVPAGPESQPVRGRQFSDLHREVGPFAWKDKISLAGGVDDHILLPLHELRFDPAFDFRIRRNPVQIRAFEDMSTMCVQRPERFLGRDFWGMTGISLLQ